MCKRERLGVSLDVGLHFVFFLCTTCVWARARRRDLLFSGNNNSAVEKKKNSPSSVASTTVIEMSDSPSRSCLVLVLDLDLQRRRAASGAQGFPVLPRGVGERWLRARHRRRGVVLIYRRRPALRRAVPLSEGLRVLRSRSLLLFARVRWRHDVVRNNHQGENRLYSVEHVAMITPPPPPPPLRVFGIPGGEVSTGFWSRYPRRGHGDRSPDLRW